MPIINWITAHTGIPGNEKAGQAAKRGLRLDRIHTTVDTSTFREQTRMKDQMERHYNEQAYSDALIIIIIIIYSICIALYNALL